MSADRARSGYDPAVSALAEQLRRETLRAARAATAQARLETALRLGDSDVALRAAATGRPEAEARRDFARQRARGRRSSTAAER